MQRTFNWVPKVDPVLEVLLQAGASPNGRNSLNMTALMLVATSLLAQLECHVAFSSCQGEDLELERQVAQAVAVAAATARLLLAAGADPAVEMRGFGTRWDAGSRSAELLPAPIRFARYVLHLERYTVHQAFEVMRHTLDGQIQTTGSSGSAQCLDEFAALLLPTEAPGAAAATNAGVYSSGGLSTAPPGDGPSAAAAAGVVGSDTHDAKKPAVVTTGGYANSDGFYVGKDCGSSLDTCKEATPGFRESDRLRDDLRPQQLPQERGQHPPERRQQYLQPEQARLQVPVAARDSTWPWIQAMSNIVWAVSQVAMVETAPGRRAFLRQLVREAPFCLPPMAVVSAAQLRAEGCIPRYSRRRELREVLPSTPSSLSPPEPAYQPLAVDDLPPSAVVVFVSHRWLGRGSPDDDHRTKLKQVMAIAAHMSKRLGVPEDDVYLWLDYSVIDQDNPMPGVQALPVYIACCEEFVYIHHDEYWQRAWCLTEQFMHWKLATTERKHALDPHTLDLTSENAWERPPDPTYGKLAVEADRVALATMTSILPYEL
ncbi:hypothetical protein VaNZ11_002681 [Volvox africanus]|uniref:Uncharacterized protein n=1 Tax=Volvox africanus TaxID=51714 RepID=A0ABQ5RT86_9CHLO|nr:hypothetical protein VaNZ11_002681 [Volvox africanus]